MHRKQLAALFVINMVPFIIGNGLLPNLPVYMVELGGSESSTGLYLALAFAALFTGTLTAGWITQHGPTNIQIRRMIILAGACLALPSVILMGQVSTPLLLTILMSIVWFTGGLRNTAVNTLIGMYAKPTQRGKYFGIMGISAGCGGIIGGLTSGYLAENQGFETLFLVIGLTEVASIIAGLFVEDRTVRKSAIPITGTASAESDMSLIFWLLFVAAWMVAILHFIAGLGRPLKMHELEFGPAAIASTATVIGITNLFIPFLAGYLSDRFERRWLLITCYSFYLIGSLVLAYSTALWQFWLTSALFSAGWAALNVGAALITDLVPSETLDKAMSRYLSAPWIGGVLGFGAGGFIIRAVGTATTFILATGLPILAILLILVIRDNKHTSVPETPPVPIISGD